MVAEIAGGWIAFAVVFSAGAILSFFLSRYYEDKHDRETITLVTFVLGLSVVFAALALVPVDVFIVSSTMDTETGQRAAWATPEAVADAVAALEITYYVSYSLLMLFAFVLIPFVYFYYEEYDGETDWKGRSLGALKYTSFTIIIMVIVFILGLVLKPGEAELDDPEWYKDLLNANDAVRAVTFVIACLTLLGLFIFITYTAYGLAAFPVEMIKGARDLNRDQTEVVQELEITRERQRALEAKYLGGKKMSSADRKAKNELDARERLLTRRTDVIEETQSSWLMKLANFLRPFQIVFGIFFLLLSWFLIVSLFITAIDRAASVHCGADCSFIPKLVNPLDEMLLAVSRTFPVDYIFSISIAAYFFVATLFGVVVIGIRILWVTLFKIRPRATTPQALLLLVFLLVMALMALTMFLMSLAPQYTSFGYQMYCNATESEPSPCLEKPELLTLCNLDAPEEAGCTQTAVSKIFARIHAMQPFFSVAFYAGYWIFIAAFLVSTAVAVFRRKRPAYQAIDSDDED